MSAALEWSSVFGQASQVVSAFGAVVMLGVGVLVLAWVVAEGLRVLHARRRGVGVSGGASVAVGRLGSVGVHSPGGMGAATVGTSSLAVYGLHQKRVAAQEGELAAAQSAAERENVLRDKESASAEKAEKKRFYEPLGRNPVSRYR